MVNNSNNINKTNNRLSPQILNTKRPRPMTLEIHIQNVQNAHQYDWNPSFLKLCWGP